MKKSVTILAIILLAALAPSRVNAQEWERIGWQGGEINIEAQLGSTLFGVSNYCLYKSTDWGKTWSMFTSGLPPSPSFYNDLKFVQLGDKMCIDFSAGFGGTDQSGIFFCREGDNSWSFKNIKTIKDAPPSILFWSSDSLFAFRGADNPELDGFYFSDDSGDTWQHRMDSISTFFGFYSRGMSQGSHFYVGVYNPRAYYHTSDFGLSWKKFDIPLSVGDDIYPIGDSTIMMPYRGEMYRSTNYGAEWSMIRNSGDDIKTMLRPSFMKQLGKRSFFFAGSSTNAIFFISNDLGAHWKKSFLRDTDIVSMNIFGSENYYVSTIKKYTTPATLSSALFSCDTTFSAFYPAVPEGILSNKRKLVFVEKNMLFALPLRSSYLVEFYDSILISSDNGSTWIQKKFSGQNKLDQNKWVVYKDNVFASGMNKDSLPSLFKSTDGGDSWHIIGSFQFKDRIRSFAISGDTIVLQLIENNSYPVLFSIDNGSSWAYSNLNISQASITIRNNIITFLSTGINKLYYAFDLIILDTSALFKVDGISSTYIYGDKLFAGTAGSLSYRTISDPKWKKTKGGVCAPACDDNNILFCPCFFSNSSMNISLDSGIHWKKLGNVVPYSTDVFIGSEYIFYSGENELWRMPKSLIPLNVSDKNSPNAISITGLSPNPATTSTHITYSIPKRSDVLLEAFDVMGRKVSSIASSLQDAGSNEVVWDTKQIPSGSYIIRLSACGESISKVMEVVK